MQCKSQFGEGLDALCKMSLEMPLSSVSRAALPAPSPLSLHFPPDAHPRRQWMVMAQAFWSLPRTWQTQTEFCCSCFQLVLYLTIVGIWGRESGIENTYLFILAFPVNENNNKKIKNKFNGRQKFFWNPVIALLCYAFPGTLWRFLIYSVTQFGDPETRQTAGPIPIFHIFDVCFSR